LSFARGLILDVAFRLVSSSALVLGERHLRRILTGYLGYYHQARTHLALEKDAPDVRPIELPEAGRILQIPEVGGLHHRYVHRAA
jgi:putative transposase